MLNGDTAAREHADDDADDAFNFLDIVFGHIHICGFFDEPEEAGHKLREIAEPGDAILFKGSRGVHVERALDEFLKESHN